MSPTQGEAGARCPSSPPLSSASLVISLRASPVLPPPCLALGSPFILSPSPSLPAVRRGSTLARAAARAFIRAVPFCTPRLRPFGCSRCRGLRAFAPVCRLCSCSRRRGSRVTAPCGCQASCQGRQTSGPRLWPHSLSYCPCGVQHLSGLWAGFYSLKMAALPTLGSALDGHHSSQLRLCICFVLQLGHWPCRPCLRVILAWLRPCVEDSFLDPLLC